ncbi:MAG: hypothetical protein ACP5QX_07490 [Caldisericaceae bacterium]
MKEEDESIGYCKMKIIERIQDWCDSREAAIRKLMEYATEDALRNYRADIAFIDIVRVNLTRIVKRETDEDGDDD